ncbi:PPC domain-containing protein [cf. Phormidesmis sp. LEGE 11477]|uniref:PPC domain-containing protein n=1 Tax=cf. Phormidesmis sp. LEGE 11477 TaxID=1828680 RepID=UPI001882DAFC|nr:PPC domain-containing protein [cf. Phormidesmis sp. LEGE 11477]MBE9060035.1 PPC domain-containing protein [cf. Phormidesmis sp. LEGE 11477]
MKFAPVVLVTSLLLAAPASADINYLVKPAEGILTGQGRLENSDDKLNDGRHFDIWPFYAEAGETISIVVESSDFDPVVMLTTYDGETVNILAENDDANSNTTNSKLDINITQSGEFVFTVLGYDRSMLGNYAVNIYEAAPSQATIPQPTETSAERSARILEQAERLNRVMGSGSSTLPNDPGWTP